MHLTNGHVEPCFPMLQGSLYEYKHPANEETKHSKHVKTLRI